MPIRRELRKLYGREWRLVIRPRILARDKNRCARCRKPNKKRVETATFPGEQRMYWRLYFTKRRPTKWERWRDHKGHARAIHIPPGKLRVITVKIGVAHLDQDPRNNADENLLSLCDWCHLAHDLQFHVRRARTTRITRKDRSRPLLAVIEGAA